MTTERWKRIELMFDAASDRPAEARRAFLDHRCDDDIRLDVDALVRQHDDSKTFLRVAEVEDHFGIRP